MKVASDQESFLKNLLATTTVHEKAMMVVGLLDLARLNRVMGLPDTIDSSKPPRNYRDAMLQKDCQKWAEALGKEYMGVMGYKVIFQTTRRFELVPLKKIKLMGMTTRWEYK